ncbi:10416_t:CDS:1, partial [Cetraspora pellucida]
MLVNVFDIISITQKKIYFNITYTNDKTQYSIMKLNFSSERRSTRIWNHFKQGEKYNTSHYNANCNYCKKDCYSEPRKMTIHLMYQCKAAEKHYDDFKNDIINSNIRE